MQGAGQEREELVAGWRRRGAVAVSTIAGTCVIAAALFPSAFFHGHTGPVYLVWGFMSPFCWPLIAFGSLLIVSPFSRRVGGLLPYMAIALGLLAFLLPSLAVTLAGGTEHYYELWFRTDIPSREELDFEGTGLYIQLPLAVLMILIGLVFVAAGLLRRRQTAPGPGG